MKISRVYALAAALLAVAVAPAFAQRGGGRGPGFGFGGGAGIVMIPEVQKELKLEQAQITLIDQVMAEGREKMRALFQESQGNREGARQKMQELQAQQEKQVIEILEPAQVKRYKQLQIQQAGPRGLVRPEVAQQLKLTPSQTQSIEAAVRGEQESMRSMFESARSNGGGPEAFQGLREKMQQLRGETDKKILAVLTDAQKKQFDELKGAPFTFPEPRFGGRGGPGGGRRPNNPNN
ncbi:MAG: Spy/CpxP family protein refolding chaperone [Armatimonadota bacterium]